MQRNPSAPPSACPTAELRGTPIPRDTTAGTTAVPRRHLGRSPAEPRLTLKELGILLVVTSAVLGPAVAFSPAGTFVGSIITPLVRYHQLKIRRDSLEIGSLMVAMLESAAPRSSGDHPEFRSTDAGPVARTRWCLPELEPGPGLRRSELWRQGLPFWLRGLRGGRPPTRPI